MLATLLPYLIPIACAALTPLLKRLYTKWGIEITQDQVAALLAKLVNIVAEVELQSADEPGKTKKDIAINMAKALLTETELSILNKRYGSLDVAVQAAFEKSSVAGKSGTLQKAATIASMN